MHMPGCTGQVLSGEMNSQCWNLEIMRQRGDREFAQLLCRVRTASCSEQDINTLETRVTSEDNVDYPSDALHAYRLNKDVDEQNIDAQ